MNRTSKFSRLADIDCIIIGGGIIGMLTSLELAKTGAKVKLLDKNQCGLESTWAGGGIVSPLYPWRYNDAVSKLSHWAQTDYPTLSKELYEKTGIDPEYEECGLLMLSIEDDFLAQEWAKKFNRPMEKWNSDQIYRHNPNIKKGIESGLWCPYIGHIRPPKLRQALLKCIDDHQNISVAEYANVQRILMNGHQNVEGIELDDGQCIYCPTVVICAGAWSNNLLKSINLQCPIEPVRGQMLLFHRGYVPLSSMILGNGRYLIPRRDGRILVGSTLEYVGFDKKVTIDAYHCLLNAAYDILPALRENPIEAHWAGLRPGNSGGTPLIGPIHDIKGLYINAGHFRNGLVLAPASGRLLADIINKKTPIIDEKLYCPNNKIYRI